jgi:hypothetical protein
MQRIIWSAPDGSWGECGMDDFIIMDASSLPNDDWDVLMGGNLTESQVRLFIAKRAAEVFPVFMTGDDSQVVEHALVEAENQWRRDAVRDKRNAKDWRDYAALAASLRDKVREARNRVK